jgi:SNF2 family DNA or RNA helicase
MNPVFTTSRPLFTHQVDVINFMRRVESQPLHHGIRGGIVAAKMGLGKTMIGLMHCLQANVGNACGPTLIVCPKTIMERWREDGEKYISPKPKVLILHQDSLKSAGLKNITTKDFPKYDFVVTSYDAVRIAASKNKEKYIDPTRRVVENDASRGMHISMCRLDPVKEDKVESCGVGSIFHYPWHRVIADESHAFANPTTVLYQAMMAVPAAWRWCFTGTPFRNQKSDIWAQFSFTGYDYRDHKRWSSYDYRVHNLTARHIEMDYQDVKHNECKPDAIPDPINHVVNVVLSQQERQFYNVMLNHLKNMISEYLQNRLTYMHILAMFTRLRQVCVASNIIMKSLLAPKNDGSANDKDSENVELTTDTEKWLADNSGTAGILSSKFCAVNDILKKINIKDKVVIFTNFTSCMTLLCDSIKKNIDSDIVTLSGKDSTVARQKAITKFTTDPKTNVMVLNYKSGSEGINLVEASHCILLESWWCPAVTEQAICRLVRTGQKKNVNIYRLIVRDSIEERICAVCTNKTTESKRFKPTNKLDIDTIIKVLQPVR